MTHFLHPFKHFLSTGKINIYWADQLWNLVFVCETKNLRPDCGSVNIATLISEHLLVFSYDDSWAAIFVFPMTQFNRVCKSRQKQSWRISSIAGEDECVIVKRALELRVLALAAKRDPRYCASHFNICCLHILELQ